MGMVSNKIEVMLLTQKGEKVYWELWLDNEIGTVLTEDKSLFSASSVEEFAESIGKGFKDEFPYDDDYEPDPNFIKQYCDDFAGSNPFAEEDDVFDLEAKTVSRGCKEAAFGSGYHYDPDDCVPKSKDFIETLL